MGRHRGGGERWLWLTLAAAFVAGLGIAGTLTVVQRTPEATAPAPIATAAACTRPVQVVAATSFAPVLAGLDCVRVVTADGREAIRRAATADAWIADDTAWSGSAAALGLAPGTVVATSPLYLVADQPTLARVRAAGGSWLGLAGQVGRKDGLRLVIRDPAGSGDGMVAAAAAARAVWLDQDMDASALWLSRARAGTRIVTDGSPALPGQTGEVGIVPEYALVPALGAGGVLGALPGADHTALLRYTFFPRTEAASDPVRAAGLNRLREQLTGTTVAAAVAAAGLRPPAAAPAPAGNLPAPTAPAFDVFDPHQVDHVFATWYAADRRTNLLVAVDVSGSMADPAPGSGASRIDLVRQGCRSVAGLLPDESRMGLWEFGSRLDGDTDHRALVPTAALTREHRGRLAGAVGKLAARRTGTGLYDTILAAYTSARDSYRAGVPNQVLIFTDGRNEDDENSATAAGLAAALKRAADPDRPVLLSVITFGTAAEARTVETAIKPVQGYVDVPAGADEVAAVFIHVAAGGLHH